jgi:competence protein ComEA
MKKLVKDYFSFNKIERQGIFVLLTIILLLIAANLILPYMVPSLKYDFSSFHKEIEEFERNRIMIQEEKRKDKSRKEFDFSQPDKSVAISNIRPYNFDPNTLTQEQWLKLGLTEKQVRMIMNYRSKGGIYRSKKDFKKMYCISQDEYEILAPYIQLPDSIDFQKLYPSEKKPSYKEDIYTIEINTAGEEDLDRIKGIGAYFATQIIDYRRSLGGFYRKEQLLEVHKMDSARYAQMLPYITLNTAAIRHMDVNSATFEELSKHPYIGYNVALSLINYRVKHGKFKQLQDIKKSALVTEELYAKISPYLRAE